MSLSKLINGLYRGLVSGLSGGRYRRSSGPVVAELRGGAVLTTTSVVIRATVPFDFDTGTFTISRNGGAWYNSSTTTSSTSSIGNTFVISSIVGIAAPIYGDTFLLTTAANSFAPNTPPPTNLPAVTNLAIANTIAIAAPPNFAAVSTGTTSIGLSWDNPHSLTTVVYRTDSGGTIIGSAIYSNTGTSTSATGLTPATLYYFKAQYSGGPFTSVVSAATDFPAPQLVGNPVIPAGGNSITFTFDIAVSHSGGSITFAGTSATLGAYTSGDATTSITYALTGLAVNGETITCTIAADKFLTATLTGNALITGHAVTNNTAPLITAVAANAGTWTFTLNKASTYLGTGSVSASGTTTGAIVLTYASGSGTTTLTFTGVPDAVNADTLTYNAVAGAFIANGIGTASVSGGSVTNNTSGGGNFRVTNTGDFRVTNTGDFRIVA